MLVPAENTRCADAQQVDEVALRCGEQERTEVDRGGLGDLYRMSLEESGDCQHGAPS